MNITMKNGHFDLDLDQCKSGISKLQTVIGGSPLAYAYYVFVNVCVCVMCYECMYIYSL